MEDDRRDFTSRLRYGLHILYFWSYMEYLGLGAEVVQDLSNYGLSMDEEVSEVSRASGVRSGTRAKDRRRRRERKSKGDETVPSGAHRIANMMEREHFEGKEERIQSRIDESERTLSQV